MKKVIIISIILSLLGAFAFIEHSMRQNQCEPILNFAGPNYPYCFTTLFNIPGTFGVLIMAAFIGAEKAWGLGIISSLLGNFIFYFTTGCVILFLIRLFKKLTKKQRRKTGQQL